MSEEPRLSYGNTLHRFELEHALRIVQELSSHKDGLCFRDLAENLETSKPKLKAYLERLCDYRVSKERKILSWPKSKKRKRAGSTRMDCYKVTEQGLAWYQDRKWLLDFKEKAMLKPEEITVMGVDGLLESRYPDFYTPLKEALRFCFNTITEAEGLWTGGFATTFRFESEKCEGSIKIEWTLTLKERERRQKLFERRPRVDTDAEVYLGSRVEELKPETETYHPEISEEEEKVRERLFGYRRKEA